MPCRMDRECVCGCHPSGMGIVFGMWTGGVVALLLNHRLIAGNPPGSGGAHLHPGGMAAISRGLSGATPPERGSGTGPIPKGSQGVGNAL